jgi:hypothetical protein
MTVRASLIVADAAGSGLMREGYSIAGWIRETFDRLDPWHGDQVREKILNERIAELTRSGKWKDLGHGKGGWSDFQLACDNLR